MSNSNYLDGRILLAVYDSEWETTEEKLPGGTLTHRLSLGSSRNHFQRMVNLVDKSRGYSAAAEV